MARKRIVCILLQQRKMQTIQKASKTRNPAPAELWTGLGRESALVQCLDGNNHDSKSDKKGTPADNVRRTPEKKLKNDGTKRRLQNLAKANLAIKMSTLACVEWGVVNGTPPPPARMLAHRQARTGTRPLPCERKNCWDPSLRLGR